MLVEYRDAVGVEELDRTAEVLHVKDGVCGSVTETKKMLRKMMDRGRMYKLLEDNLGVKVCFVLGTSLSETYWTKLLTKSTPRLPAVVAQIRTTTVTTIGQQFSSVEREVIRAGYNHMIQGRTDWVRK